VDVFQTDQDGFFVEVTQADPDPMDSENWLIPAGCVKIKPPECKASQIPRWDGSSWCIVEIPALEFNQEVNSQDPSDLARSRRNELLQNSDWTQLPDVTVDRCSWAKYRSSLRDLPQQKGFPDNILWPLAPK